MSSERWGSNAEQAAPVYTIYPVPAENRGNSNYGYYQSNPHAPPPKYEDVISGMSGTPVLHAQSPGAYDTQEHPSFMVVSPVYKQTAIQRLLGFLFVILFIIVFLSVIIKIFTIPNFKTMDS